MDDKHASPMEASRPVERRATALLSWWTGIFEPHPVDLACQNADARAYGETVIAWKVCCREIIKNCGAALIISDRYRSQIKVQFRDPTSASRSWTSK